ncbi:MAG TPA: hypothetical protein VGK18_08125 [Propionicimonas sp.]|uniref:hypothetical protein n=1 Tax=Propionicimonas sp. TaxID=1955623 RepID=UPI002F3FFE99
MTTQTARAHAAHLSPPSSRARRLTAALAAGVLGLSLLAASPAQANGTSFCPDGTQPYVPVSEVEAYAAGDTVTGLSVTRGTTPEAFSGTYIGYIDDGIGLGKDMLLFKLSSAVIDGTGGLKAAGIWAGMSGSPVYKDGRLIGSVSYSLNADNLPVAGVTPAEYMKTIGTSAVGTASRVKLTKANLKVSASGVRAAGTTLVGATLSQVRTVNVAGGAGEKLNAFANRTFGRTPTSAKAGIMRGGQLLPAAAVSSTITAPLVAGGTVAALYGSGDLVSGAVGTVTAVCGNTVWAFGHPMDYIGTTSLYLANASTALIVPDGTGRVGSYKQVSAFGAPIGMITQDRLVGIRGTIGATKGYGIDVAVQNPSGTQVGTYHGDLAYQSLSGAAIAYLIGQAALNQLDQYSTGTGEVSWTIGYRRADGSTGSLENSQVVSDPSWFPDAIGTPAGNDAAAIAGNEFEDVTITGVAVTVKLLSADAFSYTPSAMQVRTRSGSWISLDGKRLKAGNTYSLRPQYTIRKNGRNAGKVSGAPISVRLKSTARRSGTFTFNPVNQPTESCETLPSGETVCEEFEGTTTEGLETFDDLIAMLDDVQPDSAVEGTLHYRLRKGSTTRVFDWSGPGVVTGSVEATFSIKA